MSDPHTSTPSEAERPSPERAKALQSLSALNLGDGLDLTGLVCDPDDLDCVVEGVDTVEADTSTSSPGPATGSK